MGGEFATDFVDRVFRRISLISGVVVAATVAMTTSTRMLGSRRLLCARLATLVSRSGHAGLCWLASVFVGVMHGAGRRRNAKRDGGRDGNRTILAWACLQLRAVVTSNDNIVTFRVWRDARLQRARVVPVSRAAEIIRRTRRPGHRRFLSRLAAARSIPRRQTSRQKTKSPIRGLSPEKAASPAVGRRGKTRKSSANRRTITAASARPRTVRRENAPFGEVAGEETNPRGDGLKRDDE